MKKKGILARAEIDVIICWMWYFAKHYNIVDKINISAELLLLYMTEDQESYFVVHDEDFCCLLIDFMTASYLGKCHKMLDVYMPGMTLGQVTSSNNESYHSAVKYVTNGPRPYHDLNESRYRLDHKESNYNHVKAKRNNFDTTLVYGKQEDRDNYVREFTVYCNDSLRNQSMQGHKYLLHQESEDKFYVKIYYTNHKLTAEEDLEEFSMYCQYFLEAAEESMEGCKNCEKKAIHNIVVKQLGTTFGALEQYQYIFLHMYCEAYAPQI